MCATLDQAAAADAVHAAVDLGPVEPQRHGTGVADGGAADGGATAERRVAQADLPRTSAPRAKNAPRTVALSRSMPYGPRAALTWLPSRPGVLPSVAPSPGVDVEVDAGPAGCPDFEVLLRAGARLLILEDGREHGYALIEAGQPKSVAATTTPAAVALLWAALAESDGPVSVEVLRADQQWAIGVVHPAGLGLEPGGPLCRQGDTGPLMPYLPHIDVL